MICPICNVRQCGPFGRVCEPCGALASRRLSDRPLAPVVPLAPKAPTDEAPKPTATETDSLYWRTIEQANKVRDARIAADRARNNASVKRDYRIR
jgi:hypothetical protein